MIEQLKPGADGIIYPVMVSEKVDQLIDEVNRLSHEAHNGSPPTEPNTTPEAEVVARLRRWSSREGRSLETVRDIWYCLEPMEVTK